MSTLVHHAMLISCANDLCFLIRTVRNTCAMSVLLISSVTSPSPKKCAQSQPFKTCAASTNAMSVIAPQILPPLQNAPSPDASQNSGMSHFTLSRSRKKKKNSPLWWSHGTKAVTQM